MPPPPSPSRRWRGPRRMLLTLSGKLRAGFVQVPVQISPSMISPWKISS